MQGCSLDAEDELAGMAASLLSASFEVGGSAGVVVTALSPSRAMGTIVARNEPGVPHATS
jgi:hypothetical protein